MNTPKPSSLDVTIDTPVHESEPSRFGFTAKKELVEGSLPRFPSATQELLQSRLRAVTLMLTIAFGLYLLRSFFFFSTSQPIILGYHILLTIGLAAGYILLSARRLATNRLRMLEITIFSSTAIFFALVQYYSIVQATKRGDAALLVAGMKSSLIYLYSMMILYGMVIPNHWRRAAAVIVPIALIRNSSNWIFRAMNSRH